MWRPISALAYHSEAWWVLSIVNGLGGLLAASQHWERWTAFGFFLAVLCALVALMLEGWE